MPEPRPARPADSSPVQADFFLGLVTFSNKLCAHATTHQCPFLTDSSTSLCPRCATAVANGMPCE